MPLLSSLGYTYAMTKLVLHGGRLKLKDERNDTYFQELTKELQDGDELLWVGFARETEEDKQEAFEREKGLILAQTKARIKIVEATEPDFSTQIKQSKAIHITGGNSPKLIEAVQKHPDFIKLLNSKVVGGSSAGAALFSTYYWSGATLKSVNKGLGTLPIRLMVHYGNPEFGATEETRKKLEKYPDNLELVLLEECEWRVFGV